MNASFIAYGFEQLNQIRDCVVDGEKDNQSQEEILSSLVEMFVNLTDEADVKSLTISKFVTDLFVNSIKLAYKYFKQNDDISLPECIEITSQMAVYAKDLSALIEDEQ